MSEKVKAALKEFFSETSGWTCKQAGESLACLCQKCVTSSFYQNTHTKKCMSVTPLHVTFFHKKDVFLGPPVTPELGSSPPSPIFSCSQLLVVVFSIAIPVSYGSGSPETCFAKCKAHPISGTWIAAPYESI